MYFGNSSKTSISNIIIFIHIRLLLIGRSTVRVRKATTTNVHRCTASETTHRPDLSKSTLHPLLQLTINHQKTGHAFIMALDEMNDVVN